MPIQIDIKKNNTNYSKITQMIFFQKNYNFVRYHFPLLDRYAGRGEVKERWGRGMHRMGNLEEGEGQIE